MTSNSEPAPQFTAQLQDNPTRHAVFLPADQLNAPAASWTFLYITDSTLAHQRDRALTVFHGVKDSRRSRGAIQHND
jgi:F0F1-type ATP synthase beta subunit